MFEVTISTLNNVFKPEIMDKTVIVLKQAKPFVQMSYSYDGDFSKISDEEAIRKVMDDFYDSNYKDKIQDGKLLQLELLYLEQKDTISKITAQLKEINKEPEVEEYNHEVIE